LQLAYPGEDSSYTKRYGIDAFIASLNNAALEFDWAIEPQALG